MKDDRSHIEEYVCDPTLAPNEQISAAAKHYEKYQTPERKRFSEIFNKITDAETLSDLLVAEEEANKHEGGFALAEIIFQQRRRISDKLKKQTSS
jgi:hypothetical protein